MSSNWMPHFGAVILVLLKQAENPANAVLRFHGWKGVVNEYKIRRSDRDSAALFRGTLPLSRNARLG